MAYRSTVIAALTLMAIVPVSAAPKAPPSAKTTEKISCREFIALRDEFKPQVVSYALGYDRAKRPEARFVDVSGIETIVPVLISSCRARPDESLLQRVRAEIHRL
jgi:hypothetical protein